MSLKDEDWREDSLEFYRAALVFLEELKALSRDDMDYYLEEMRDTLLDLKQAVIDSDPPRSWNARAEFRILQTEALGRLDGEE